MIRVAKYYVGKPLPETPDFKNILIHTKSVKTLGVELSPYVLTNEEGQLVENVWQFSKVYEKVEEQKIPLSRFQPNTIVWEHPAETHVVDGEIQPAYWAWRKKGMQNSYAVRYPNGFNGRRKCLYSLWPVNDDDVLFEQLDYIQARKKIYCGEYARLAPKTNDFICGIIHG